MKTKQLGKTDLQISPIVFGGSVFGWTLDERASLAMLDDLIDRGFTTIDTADWYSRWAEGNQGGESETIIGKWMTERRNRDKVTLITKVGHDMGQGHHDLSADYLARSCEDSLRRLQTDRIDLYFSHFDDERTEPEETLRAHDKLVKEGKVRYIGASNVSAERIEESLRISQANGLASYQVVQPEYNLIAREPFESSYAPLIRKHHFGAITYFALASGFLTGKYHSESDINKSRRGGGMKRYLCDDARMKTLRSLEHVAADHQMQPAAIALAWVMANSDVTAPIASATKSKHLDAFEQAVSLDLSENDCHELVDAAAVRE
ncbi:General stress protein 69 [Novipirellula aureliae]|uniref:General stress protein 69 n=1 Tax=Novipirellula aureliae TaxID=2527966 RepID=A0A5C6DXH9_9BACT|nr:aldo/keto reductase [Novipirellula aureliae]TWU40091.1 General stress protein 69 [Novipirellula aureliae]